MSNQILVSIDCNKIDQSRIKIKPTGRYLDLILIPSKGKFNHTHLVKQDLTQEEREKGIKLPIAGSAREFIPETKPVESGGFMTNSEPVQNRQDVPY